MPTLSLGDHRTSAKACFSTLFIVYQLYEYATKGMGEIRQENIAFFMEEAWEVASASDSSQFPLTLCVPDSCNMRSTEVSTNNKKSSNFLKFTE